MRPRAADVAVIGGGVIGCAVAYYAARRGLAVTLVDRPRRGRATSASAGGLWPLGESLGLGCGVIFHRTRGAAPDGVEPGTLPEAFLRFALRSNAMFPDLAEALRESSGMDIEWEPTSLLFVLLDEADEAFAHAVRARCPEAGRRTSWLGPEELARVEPALTREARGALRFLGDDQVNPFRLADALRSAARALGATILSGAEVTGLRRRVGRVEAVETTEGPIPCAWAVNAAGAWAGRIGRMVDLDIPVQPVRGQMLGTETLPRRLHACVSTSECYLAQKHHGELVVGSTTEDVGFETDVTSAALRDLAAGAVRAMPDLDGVRLKRTWSGLRPGTPDQLPILGPVAGLGGYLNACGHFRTGILNAPLTGLLLAELAAGAPPSVPIEPFLLARFAEHPSTVAAAGPRSS